MAFVLEKAALATDLQVVAPWITTWSRLEVLPTSPDLSTGLQAVVADPLWLLHRQQAFLELRGEDAGSPVDVRLSGRRGRITRLHPGRANAAGAATAIDVDDLASPLEVVVERESPGRQRRHAAATGQDLVRRFRAAHLDVDGLHAAFALELPAPADALADQPGAAWHAVATGRAVDGAAVADALHDLLDDAGELTGVPDVLDLPPGRRGVARDVLAAWLTRHDGLLAAPTRSSWLPDRQEYAFVAAAHLDGGQVALRADEYADGHLDWYDFVAATGPDLGGEPDEDDDAEVTWTPRIPTPVRYPGMPADRLWEFEDARVNLGGLEAGPGDLGRLLLVEFGLVFGNDWFVVPIEMEVGSLFRVTTLQVRDTFGEVTDIGPSTNPSGGPAWEMFELSTGADADPDVRDLFLLPPVLSGRLEGDPIEEVRWVRDEMANLAWGIERLVPGTSGDPNDRTLESARQAVHQQVGGDPGDAQLVYRLQTPVPVHWIPFAPEATAPVTSPDFDIVLQRRALLRTLADGTLEEVHPVGRILRTDPTVPVGDEPPLEVQDEEVARDGAVVTRTFQYARWHDGSIHLWVGRAKRTGRGEAASGLRWDTSDKQS